MSGQLLHNLENQTLGDLVYLLYDKKQLVKDPKPLRKSGRKSYVHIGTLLNNAGAEDREAGLYISFEYLEPKHINRVWATEPYQLIITKDIITYWKGDIVTAPTTELIQCMKQKIIEEIKYINANL